MEELDIKQIIKYICQRKNVLIYILLISILIGLFYTFIIKRPIYQTTAQILIDKTDSSIEEFIISRDILNREEIQPKFNKTSRLISITTEMKNKEEAFNEINIYIENLKTKLEEVYNVKTFKIIETPQFPKKAINISYSKDILICVVIGTIIYALYIILIINMNGITNNSEIENNIGIKVLGKINLEKNKNKNKNQTISYNSENKNIINQLKRIEANIELSKQNKKPRIILLTGNKKGVGNTYITNNLAIQYAKLYKKVLIIDTNMYNKTLTNLYNKKDEKGLVDIIKDSKVEDIEKLVSKTERENIFILPVGKGNIGEELFLKETINKIMEELKQKYDLILIDTQSINEHIHPISLASIADATVLIVDETKTKLEQIIMAKNTIENVGGNISGVIINKVI